MVEEKKDPIESEAIDLIKNNVELVRKRIKDLRSEAQTLEDRLKNVLPQTTTNNTSATTTKKRNRPPYKTWLKTSLANKSATITSIKNAFIESYPDKSDDKSLETLVDTLTKNNKVFSKDKSSKWHLVKPKK